MFLKNISLMKIDSIIIFQKLNSSLERLGQNKIMGLLRINPLISLQFINLIPNFTTQKDFNLRVDFTGNENGYFIRPTVGR
jgi:hypothetical protein